jgi:hypothetical protein
LHDVLGRHGFQASNEIGGRLEVLRHFRGEPDKSQLEMLIAMRDHTDIFISSLKVCTRVQERGARTGPFGRVFPCEILMHLRAVLRARHALHLYQRD